MSCSPATPWSAQATPPIPRQELLRLRQIPVKNIFVHYDLHKMNERQCASSPEMFDISDTTEKRALTESSAETEVDMERCSENDLDRIKGDMVDITDDVPDGDSCAQAGSYAKASLDDFNLLVRSAPESSARTSARTFCGTSV